MIRDPIELWVYPKEWVEKCSEVNSLSLKEIKKLVDSGFYIIKSDGRFIKRGITTGTTASLAVKASILSLLSDLDVVDVKTPVGITVRAEVYAKKGRAVAKKFSGYHAFDVTRGIEIVARTIKDAGVYFGYGIGELKGKKAVSEKARWQIENAYKEAVEILGKEVGVLVEIPRAMEIYNKTGNERFGIKNGISILGTTGFVEPWCRELIDVKKEICKQYDMVAITTGRKGFEFALKYMGEYKPMVVGVYVEEFLKELDNREIAVVGLPSLLLKWADKNLKGRILRHADKEFIKRHAVKILEKARRIANIREVVLIDEKGGILTWLR